MKNKKTNYILILSIVAILILAIYFFKGENFMQNSNPDSGQSAPLKISSQQAKEIIDSRQVIILDVRTKQEYNEGHIPNALNYPNEDITTQSLDILPNFDDEILIYCRSGVRSKDAAQKLFETGYTNVKDFGGIISWQYDIVKD